MFGDLPPSSRATGVRAPAAAAITIRAVAPPPVKVSLSMPGWPASADPVAAPPTTTLSTPGGRPASRASSAKRSMPNGATSGGLATTALPAARAGPHFCPIPTIDPFHGGMTPTTP